MEICGCNIEKYTGNIGNDEDILLCNICGKIDLRADDQSIQYHDDIAEELTSTIGQAVTDQFENTQQYITD